VKHIEISSWCDPSRARDRPANQEKLAVKSAALLPTVLLFAAGTTMAQSLAFTDVTVIDVVEGAAQPGRTVIVMGDRIGAVGETSKIEVPAAATVIDGRGKFLIPGLWDMHVHTSTDRVTRRILFPLFIANGVTGIRSMAADCFESGEPTCVDERLSEPLASIRDVMAWRRDMESGTLVGPRMIAGSANLHGPRPGSQSTLQNPGTPEDARAHVGLLQERGVDFIKVYSEFPREAYFALAEAALEQGLPLAGHVPVTVRASEASLAGQRSIEHIGPGNELEECSSREEALRDRLAAALGSDDGVVLPILREIAGSYDERRCAEVFRTFVENDTWVVPTLILARLPAEIESEWRDDPRARFLRPDERSYWSEWEKIYESMLGTPREQQSYSHWIRLVARSMHRAGVRFLAGTDAGFPGIYWGSTLHEELRLLVSAGLTEAEALRAATLSPARYLEATDSLGTIEAGKVADLLLLEASPLEDIANTQRIVAVVARGRLFDREGLAALVAGAARAAQQD
jgi:hypothetical protein